MKNFTKLFKYLKPYKKWALLAPLLIILEVVMDLFLPNIMANIVNIGIGNKDIVYILISIGIMVLLTIAGVVGGLASTYFAAKASQYTTSDLRTGLFEKISKLSMFNLDNLKTGHLITLITNDISIIGSVIMMGLRFVFRVPIILIGSIIMAVTISGKLSIIIVVIIPIMIILVTIVMKKAFPYFTLTQESVDEVNSVVRENLGGIRVVKSFVTEEQEMKRFDKVNEQVMNIMVKAIRIMSVSMPLMMLLINLATIVILLIGGIEVSHGNMQVGNIMAFIQYLVNILSSLMMASMVFIMIARTEASSKRINDVFALENDLENRTNPLNVDKIEGRIEFKNVSFSYIGGTGDAVLRNIDFIINPGEVVAILGATGSGKSTLVNLIPRFYDVSSGEILIDDINIKDFSLSFLREKVGIALQQTLLFSDTIRNNIKYGNEQATDEEMIEAAKIASAHEFINRKKGKYDYVLEQKGTNLSGGQKQRIAIARTILSNPSILILDDSTSAIDMKTERNIRKSLKTYLKGHTTLIVAQRISSAIDADRIIVLEDGQIVGMGNHDELIKNNTIYQDIYNSQISKDGEK